MRLHRVKIVTEEDRFNTTRCYIDDVEVKFITGIESGQAPKFTIETVGMADIDLQGQVLFGFTPQTVEEAVKVLQHEFKTNPESRKALVDSIASVLKEMEDGTGLYIVAESVANRIVGI